jgi:hypothetical protein
MTSDRYHDDLGERGIHQIRVLRRGSGPRKKKMVSTMTVRKRK